MPSRAIAVDICAYVEEERPIAGLLVSGNYELDLLYADETWRQAFECDVEGWRRSTRTNASKRRIDSPCLADKVWS